MSGWWWCQVRTPKIMKGKWKITGTIRTAQVNYAVYIDGVHTANIKNTDAADITLRGNVDWTVTAPHTIKVVALSLVCYSGMRYFLLPFYNSFTFWGVL
jgi:hypothetical protein